MDNLVPQHILDKHVTLWLEEDIPNFDYGGLVVGSIKGDARILCKSKGILCGVPFVSAVFRRLNCEVKWHFNEGDLLEPVCVVADVRGNVKDILQGERISLNILSRASGIASKCKRLHEKKLCKNWMGEVCGTRKTTPGFRVVEKYSLLIGGCSTHRYDLSSMVMLKDNHIWSVGNIEECVKKARNACGFSTKIEVECRSVNEALQACSAGADIVMLDNFDASVTEASAQEIKKQFPHVLIEVSGGLTESNIDSYMTGSIDVLSSSTLTQGYDSVDYSLKIIKDGHDPSNPVVKEMYNNMS